MVEETSVNASATEAPPQPGAGAVPLPDLGAIKIHTTLEPDAAKVPAIEREIALEL